VTTTDGDDILSDLLRIKNLLKEVATPSVTEGSQVTKALESASENITSVTQAVASIETESQSKKSYQTNFIIVDEKETSNDKHPTEKKELIPKKAISKESTVASSAANAEVKVKITDILLGDPSKTVKSNFGQPKNSGERPLRYDNPTRVVSLDSEVQKQRVVSATNLVGAPIDTLSKARATVSSIQTNNWKTLVSNDPKKNTILACVVLILLVFMGFVPWLIWTAENGVGNVTGEELTLP
jgi:hypothetical protein